jgi:hypothetical protein
VLLYFFFLCRRVSVWNDRLYHGNLVLDCAVPAKLLSLCPNKDDREVTHMRLVGTAILAFSAC